MTSLNTTERLHDDADSFKYPTLFVQALQGKRVQPLVVIGKLLAIQSLPGPQLSLLFSTCFFDQIVGIELNGSGLRIWPKAVELSLIRSIRLRCRRDQEQDFDQEAADHAPISR